MRNALVATLSWCLLSTAVNAATPRAANDPNELFMRAYVLKESNPPAARRLFRRVMRLSKPGDANYEKAKRLLDELKARSK